MVVFFFLNLNKKEEVIIMIVIRDNKKSEILLKKCFCIQLGTQLRPDKYTSTLSSRYVGLAPALDHSSYQVFISTTSFFGIDHEKKSIQVKLAG